MADSDRTPKRSLTNTYVNPTGFSADWLRKFDPHAARPWDQPKAEPVDLGERVELGERNPTFRGLRARWSKDGVPLFRWDIDLDDGGERFCFRIGRWTFAPRAGHVTLAQAHDVFLKAQAAAKEGRRALQAVQDDHMALLALEAKKPKATQAKTVQEVAELWFADQIEPLRDEKGNILRNDKGRIVQGRETTENPRRFLDRHLLPAIGSKAILDVRALDLSAIIDGIKAAKSNRAPNGPRAWARACLLLTRQFFDWAEGKGHLDDATGRTYNPAASMKPSSFGLKSNHRERVANDDEIRFIWDIGRVSEVTQAALRLELLLGCRGVELRENVVANLDYEKATLTVPPELQKVATNRPWLIPIPPAAMVIFRRLDQLRPKHSPWLLWSPAPPRDSKGKSIPGGLIGQTSLGKTAAHGSLLRARRAGRLASVTDENKVTPHDLRRTFRTGISALTDDAIVKKRCLNHVLPDVDGKVYDQYDYLPQRRIVLEKWAAKVMSIVHDDGGGNVIRLRPSGTAGSSS